METKFVLIPLLLLIAKSYQKDVEVVAASEQGTESLDEKLKWNQSLCEIVSLFFIQNENFLNFKLVHVVLYVILG